MEFDTSSSEFGKVVRAIDRKECEKCIKMAHRILKNVPFKNKLLIKSAISKYACKKLGFVAKMKCKAYVMMNKEKIYDAIKMYDTPDRVCESLQKC